MSFFNFQLAPFVAPSLIFTYPICHRDESGVMPKGCHVQSFDRSGSSPSRVADTVQAAQGVLNDPLNQALIKPKTRRFAIGAKGAPKIIYATAPSLSHQPIGGVVSNNVLQRVLHRVKGQKNKKPATRLIVLPYPNDLRLASVFTQDSPSYQSLIHFRNWFRDLNDFSDDEFVGFFVRYVESCRYFQESMSFFLSLFHLRSLLKNNEIVEAKRRFDKIKEVFLTDTGALQVNLSGELLTSLLSKVITPHHFQEGPFLHALEMAEKEIIRLVLMTNTSNFRAFCKPEQ